MGVALLAANILGLQAAPQQLETADRSQEPTQQPDPDRTGEPDAAAFVPPTSLVDDHRMLTLRFPGGTTAEIAYPADVDVHRRGATPGAWLSIVADHRDIDSHGRPVVSEKLEAHRGARDDVLREINERQPAVLLAEYPRPQAETVPLYATSAGNYFAWQVGSWTLLAHEPTGSPYAAPRDREEDRRIFAANLQVREDPDGWPIITAHPPLRVDAPYVALGAPELAAAFARSPATRLSRELAAGDHMVAVYASACAWNGRVDDRGYASWCDRATQVSFDVVGADDFVDSVAQRLQARASEYPPSVIDPDWVTGDAKEAWQAQHGQGTWVVSYFYDADLVDLNTAPADEFSDALVPRWKRISDDHRDLDPQDGLRAALLAFTGPPPPQLSHGWQGRVLELNTAEMDGSELVLDFAVLIAGAEGSTGGAMNAVQFNAVAFHYFPEADSICVLVDGESSDWLHDALTCPSRHLP